MFLAASSTIDTAGAILRIGKSSMYAGPFT